MTTRKRYDIYINTAATGIAHAADCVAEESSGALQRVAFRYTSAYLDHADAFTIDPAQLPLKPREFVLQCQGGTPGFLDDYLPDNWGRRVLSKLAFYRDKRRINSNSVIDTLAMIGNSRIGAIQIVPRGEPPHYTAGCSLAYLQAAELAAQHIDSQDYFDTHIDEMSLLYLANAGTGVGGARPKALIADGDANYLAKFNRLTQDSYNNARVELACLNMAKAAGLDVFGGKVAAGINGREVLLLERFDINTDDQSDSRRHLITINALLKDHETQSDHGQIFRYDDVTDLLRKYSTALENDLEQLLRIMLFNRAINNTDDHERNFSLINDGTGYRLSPAYDMVPSLDRGRYPVAGYQYSPYPPTLTEAGKLTKVFGLTRNKVAACVEKVREAIDHWPAFARDTGVNEEELKKIQKRFHF